MPKRSKAQKADLIPVKSEKFRTTPIKSTISSLRHTAIVHSIHKGLPLEMIAANARTSSEMVRRFYGSHVKSVLYMGSAFVEAEEKVRNTRHEKLSGDTKEIIVDIDG